MKKTSNEEGPSTFTGIKRRQPAQKAVGLKAVVSSGQHILREMGPVRGFKALSVLNQQGGFDCPGCAWPDPDDDRSTMAEYCENGAKAIAEEATTKRVDAAFFAKNSVYDLSLRSDFEIGKMGRITQPMYLPENGTHYQPISWEAAFDLTARHLNGLASPHEAVFYTSGRTSNEAAFLYQLFVRRFGTNNLPDCSNMCHESSGVALGETLGLGKGSVTLEDFYEAEVILVLGQNPGTNHPRMLTALERAKNNGATIISINPIKETGLLAFSNPQSPMGLLGNATTLTDMYLQVRINGDMPLLQALALLLLEAERENSGNVFDQAFIEQNTEGYSDYVVNLSKNNVTELAQNCGVPLAQIQAAAQVLAQKSKIIACWAMGLTQHTNAVATIQEVVNLLLLKGAIGKPGAGTCPVRGHSNVQGDRTMGINEKPPQAFLDSLERVFGFRPPQHHGLDVVEAIHAMHQGEAKVFVAMGGNFLSATPDTRYTAEALRNCALTVQVSTKLNRSHLVHGREALILPAKGRTDLDVVDDQRQFVSVENSMGIVHQSKGNLAPLSDQMMSEPLIVSRLAQAVMGADSGIPWAQYAAHYDHIRTAIEQTIPGFDDYNRRVREPNGFYLPNGPRSGKFGTATGKAHFTCSNVPPAPVLAPNEFVMMTVRSHDQFNTTIYGLDDRYRGILNERRVVLIHREDIAALGLRDGDVVDLQNREHGAVRTAERFILVDYDIPRGCIATYFPETNVLVPIQNTAEKSNTPVSKFVRVFIARNYSQK